jgi:hypothetical protein
LDKLTRTEQPIETEAVTDEQGDDTETQDTQIPQQPDGQRVLDELTGKSDSDDDNLEGTDETQGVKRDA